MAYIYIAITFRSGLNRYPYPISNFLTVHLTLTEIATLFFFRKSIARFDEELQSD